MLRNVLIASVITLGTASSALLAGCAAIQAPSGPPIAGTDPGPGAPPLKQLVEQQQHSTNASAGTATIVGANGDGTPQIIRSESPAGSIGNAPSDIAGFPVVGPSNKGGA